MIIVGVVVAVLVLGAVAAWAVARVDVPGVPDAVTTESAHPLPAGPLTAGDVHDLRFDQAVRGYRMAQVDQALGRLAGELAERDAEIARLNTAAEHTEGH
ncbi:MULTISPECIES: DivIVA domain-containing protein [unclassified Ornithinimicrobium]|uniref:DivIVA domain-containing protein n=1 Tax=unclassified Ornithinimicrobium TaxID=2615080 RepID=UPI00385297A4